MALQPEILRYIEQVADRFDLRCDIQLETHDTAADLVRDKIHSIVKGPDMAAMLTPDEASEAAFRLCSG